MEDLRDIERHLLRFSPDALIVVNDRGEILFTNDTVGHLFGYRRADLIGKELTVLLPERYQQRHHEHLAHFMKSPSNREMGARIADLFARRADGTEFPAGIRLAPFSIDGKLHVAAAVRDMTERRQINEALVVAREEADKANLAKSRFLAIASHDLRQPLQTIQLLNASLLKMTDQPNTRELLASQGQAIDSMTRLLNALLDVNRLESGAIELDIVVVSLSEIFDELRTEFASLALARRIDLVIPETSVLLRTDRTLFYQVLQNLMANALKYTERGRVVVTCDAEDRGLVIDIDDTGIGIPADRLERIFDDYYQVNTHRSDRTGIGLGLAIVREAARLLKMPVTITSQLGEGTCAHVLVPNELLDAAHLTPKHVAPARTNDLATHDARVFLVEDNAGVRAATQLFLELEGLLVVSAASVEGAESVLVSARPGDLMIADYHLDGRMTGFEILVSTRKRLKWDIPAVIMSGDLPSVLRAVKADVSKVRFLSKPVDPDVLLAAVRELAAGS